MARVTRLDWIARAGFVARGLVYILFGFIALSTRRKAEDGQKAVFDTLQDMPAGSLLLTLLAVGLVAYAVFRIACGVLDIEGKGTDPKGLAGRAAQFGSGLFYLALAYTATQFIGGGKPEGNISGSGTSQQAAKTLLDLNLDEIGLWIVAAGFVFAGGLQFRKAWKGSHMKQCSHDTPPFAKTLGQLGLVTRGLVFLVIAWSFVRVADTKDPQQAKAAGAAIVSLHGTEWLYTAVAVGLILFGVFSLILARYRCVPAIDVKDAAQATAHKVAAKVEAKT